MGKYRKSLFIVFVISLFLLVDNVSALSFSSTSVRTAYYYENGQLIDTGFVSTNPRTLPQYASSQTGNVSLRLYQWRYSTGSALPIGRYKILTDITFSSLNGNSIYNFLSPKFEEIRCGSSSSNASEDNVDLINYEFKYINENKFQFNYTIDVLSNSCSLFSGILKYEPNEYMSRYDVNTSTSENQTLSYYTSYQELEKTDNQDILDNQDKNTQDVIDNNNANTDNIINNQDSNTQDIIDNNKENTDKIIGTIESCKPGNNLLNITNKTTSLNGLTLNSNNGVITISGTASSAGTFTLGTITLDAGTYSQSTNGDSGYSAYSILRSVKDGTEFKVGNGSFTLTETTTLTYEIYFNKSFTGTFTYKPMVNKGSTSLPWERYGEICSNKLDDISGSVDNLTGAITDSSSPDTSGLSNAAGWLPAGPIDSLLTLPITLLQTLTNNLGSSCSPINLPLPFVKTNLSLACPSVLLGNINGFTIFWNSLGVIAGGWLLYKYFINLYKWFNSVTSMKEDEQDEDWGGV